MEFTKLKLTANSCYMDSLFIFILLYKNTPFFSKFYTKIDVNNNKNIPNSLKNNKAIQNAAVTIPHYFTELYNNICKNSNNSTVAVCRLDIRNELNTIGSMLVHNSNEKGRIGKKTFKQDWLKGQQDSSELLEFLMYIYNINTNINYDINKYYKYYNRDKKYIEIKEINYTDSIKHLSQAHRNDYIGYKFDYHITTYVEENLKIISNKILDPVKTNISPLHVNTIGDALIVFNKVNLINLTHRKAEEQENDNFILVTYKIKDPLPIFIIQINRLLITNSNNFQGNYANFNDTIINIPEYFSNPDNALYKYILIGGTVHNGGANGGHYTAYILNPTTGTYFYYNNSGGQWNEIGSYANLISTADFNRQCTLLFYILESDYIIEKRKTCQVTQETLETQITEDQITEDQITFINY